MTSNWIFSLSIVLFQKLSSLRLSFIHSARQFNWTIFNLFFVCISFWIYIISAEFIPFIIVIVGVLLKYFLVKSLLALMYKHNWCMHMPSNNILNPIVTINCYVENWQINIWNWEKKIAKSNMFKEMNNWMNNLHMVLAVLICIEFKTKEKINK